MDRLTVNLETRNEEQDMTSKRIEALDARLREFGQDVPTTNDERVAFNERVQAELDKKICQNYTTAKYNGTGRECWACGRTFESYDYVQITKRGEHAGHIKCQVCYNPTLIQYPDDITDDEPTVESAEDHTKAVEALASTLTKVADSKPANAAGGWESGLVDAITQQVQANVGNLDEVKAIVADAKADISMEAKAIIVTAKAIIDEALGGIEAKPRQLEISVKDVVSTVKIPHKKFDQLATLVGELKHDVYLYGPPASGKSTATEDLAKALGLDYGTVTFDPQLPMSKLVGYGTASGQYMPTEFYNLYKNGGVFCGDEQDNASAGTATALNTALANNRYTFPTHDEATPRHKNFVYVGCGNTSGQGGNLAYPDRRRFDQAFADRFTFLNWGYDPAQEQAITLSIADDMGVGSADALAWFKLVQSIRTYCHDNHPEVVCTPRASYKGVGMLAVGIKHKDIATALIFKGLDDDTAKYILNEVSR